MATDPAKSKAVVQVVQQHPGMSLAAISPGIVVFGLAWWLIGFWWALVLAIVIGGAGYYLLTRKK